MNRLLPRKSAASRRGVVHTGIQTLVASLFINASATASALAADLSGLNDTQRSMTAEILATCPTGRNESTFQARCNEIVGVLDTPTSPGFDPNVSPGLDSPSSGSVGVSALDALRLVSPGQVVGQGTQATRTSIASQVAAIGGRLGMLRAGASGFSMSGLAPGSRNAYASLLPTYGRGGSAGAEGGLLSSRLGGFLHGDANFGEIDSTFNQLGYDFDGGGVTAGLDYRVTEQLVLGGAFAFGHQESDFSGGRGTFETNSYTGSVYGTFYPTQNFYLDGIASYGGADYEIIRNISYSIPAATINTQARGTPSGQQFSISAGGGYNHVIDSLTINPYARFNYIDLDIDAFSETGGAGWGMRFDDQNVESLTSTLGLQFSNAFSTSFGVLVPYVRGEWRHEFKDTDRLISVRFIGDTAVGNAFQTFTDSADRNYFMVGTGVSAQLAHGISGFVAYDTLLGFSQVEAHTFTAGARIEF